MKKSAIIVAGGKGLRMGSDIPKQFIQIEGKPIVIKTIERFLTFDPDISLILVIPPDQQAIWEQMKMDFIPNKQISVVYGGSTRFESVQNGLITISEGLVAIHDAVRPYVSIQTIQDSFESARTHGSGVAVVDLKDSIRELTQSGSKSRNRADFKLVQTPQTFRVNEIKKAFEQAEGNDFLDDASVYEAAGNQVSLVNGSYENIKITTPEDLK